MIPDTNGRWARHPSTNLNLLHGNGIDKAVIEQWKLHPVIVAFQKNVVRIEFAVNDPAGVQVTGRLRHLPWNTDSRSHPDSNPGIEINS